MRREIGRGWKTGGNQTESGSVQAHNVDVAALCSNDPVVVS